MATCKYFFPSLTGLVLSIFLGCVPSLAQGKEAGAFVTQSQGVVQLAPRAGAVANLGRLASGTRVRIDDGGVLQLIYLKGARQETWRGRAELQVGEGASLSLGKAEPERVQALPAYLVSALAGSAVTTPGVQPRRAMIRVRSLGNAQADSGSVQLALERYRALSRQLEAHDITPELFLLAELERLQAFATMAEPLESLARKRPRDLAVEDLRQTYLKGLPRPE